MKTKTTSVTPNHSSLLQDMLAGPIVAVLSAGLISGIITTIFTISLVSLIFSGKLAKFVPYGVGWFLVGAVVLGLWIALSSSYRGNVASPQGKPAVVLVLSAAAISASVNAVQLLPTVCMLIVVTSLVTGICLYLLGYFRVGNLTRFIPFPVIGGFQVGTGWLIVVGAFSVLTGHKLSIANLATLSTPEMLWRWVPALLYAIVMLLVLRYKAHFMSLFVLLLGGILLFHLVVWGMGASYLELRQARWLLGPFPKGSLWQLPTMQHVSWGAISSQTPTILVVVLFAATDVLLNAVAIEVATEERLDLDQELKSTGLANFASGWVGGLTGYCAISLCLLNHKIGASSRLTAVMSAVVCGVFLLWGIPLLDYFPVQVLGGLLLFIGFSFMKEWLWGGWSRLHTIDYLLLLLILVFIASWGFLEGVSAGLLIAMAIFIVNYSRTNVIKLELSGAELRSNRERRPEETLVLDEKGQQIHVMKLQGFVFFGTANHLLEQYRDLFETETGRKLPLRFVMLDFRAVTGIDSSATASFRQMIQSSSAYETQLLFANVSEDIGRILDAQGLRATTLSLLGDKTHLNDCLEWCEEQLLLEASHTAPKEHSFALVLADMFREEDVEHFRDVLIRKEFAEGEVLFTENAESDALYFIEKGQVAAWISNPFGQQERIRSFGVGAIIGEMGLYTQAPRSATLIAVEDSVLFLLTKETLDQLEKEQPLLASSFHHYIARVLAERLGQANNVLKFLLK
ncbi:MAG TPA: hypothetical protein DCE42_12080 [Myxococcales bacterium]|nr:hypothetical protein [Myxococcales bacterium]